MAAVTCFVVTREPPSDFRWCEPLFVLSGGKVYEIPIQGDPLPLDVTYWDKTVVAPDGGMYAVSGANGLFCVREDRSIGRAADGPVLSYALSRDGKIVYYQQILGPEYHLRYYNTATGKGGQVYACEYEMTFCVSEKGKGLLFSVSGSDARLFTYKLGKQAESLGVKAAVPLAVDDKVSAIMYEKDGQIVYHYLSDGARETVSIDGDVRRVYAGYDGKSALVCSSHETVHIRRGVDPVRYNTPSVPLILNESKSPVSAQPMAFTLACAELNAQTEFYALSADNTEIYALTDGSKIRLASSVLFEYALSADGKRMAFTDSEMFLHTLALSLNPENTVKLVAENVTPGSAISADGETVYYTDAAGTLNAVPFGGGEPAPVEHGIRTFALSADGKTVLYADMNDTLYRKKTSLKKLAEDVYTFYPLDEKLSRAYYLTCPTEDKAVELCLVDGDEVTVVLGGITDWS